METRSPSVNLDRLGRLAGVTPIARPNMTMASSRVMGWLGRAVLSSKPFMIPAAAQARMAEAYQSPV